MCFQDFYLKGDFEIRGIGDIDNINNSIVSMTTDYFNNYYDISDDKDVWFNKMKELSEKYGFTSNIKEYKENPDNFKGNITDIATIIRVAITKCSNTPDLYEILKVLGTEKIKERINIIK